MRTGSLVVIKPNDNAVGVGIVTTDGELIALDGIGRIEAICPGTGHGTLIQLQAVADWETQQKASALFVLHQCEVAQVQ